MRIAAARGGVDVEPLDDETRPVVRSSSALEFDLDAVLRLGAGTGARRARRAGSRASGRRSRPTRSRRLVTSITAQQVSLFSAFAIRNRLIERFGARVGDALASRPASGCADASEEELVAVGFSHRKAEYVVGARARRVDLDALALLPDDEVRATITALRGLGAVDRRVVPRAASRPAARLAGGRPRAAQGGAQSSTVSSVHELGPPLDPFQNLSAHYLLTGMRRVSISCRGTPLDWRPIGQTAREGPGSAGPFSSKRTTVELRARAGTPLL